MKTAARDIKFRALHKSGKMLFFNGDSPSFGSDQGERFASVEDVFYYHKEDFHLMQFTGLRDKNGKEIYEGDIVKGHRWSKGMCHRLIGKVDYVLNKYVVNGIGKYEWAERDDIDGSYEVIGNVYENPELLQAI
ncbi:UNVERIFIED_CONTAM: putative phage protein (TIGR01671 family) [Brevibacillus sp. OAP136]